MLKLAIILICLFSYNAFAQTADSTGVIPADTVRVIGYTNYSIATITKISSEEIANRNVSVAYDAIDGVPGFHVTQRLAFTGAGLTRLAIRGAGSAGPSGLLVFIDGRPDPTVTFVHPAPQAHNAQDIEVIEIVRGPSPVLYGSGNTGVVNIRTKTPALGWSGHLQASGGSFGTTKNFASLNYGGEKGYFSSDFTYRRTDGYLDDTDAWVGGGTVRLMYKIADQWRVKLSAGQTVDHFAVFGKFSVPGPFGNPGTTDLDLTQTVGDISLEGKLGNINTSLLLWGDALEPRSQVIPDGAEPADIAESGLRFAANASPWPSGNIVVGLDALRASAKNTPALPPTNTFVDVNISELGPYLFFEQNASPFLTISGGVRPTNHSEYGSDLSFEGGLVLKPGGNNSTSPLKDTRFNARITRGFQSPPLQQLFGVFKGTVKGPANPELGPAHVTQLEGTLQQKFGAATISVTGWIQDGKDQIIIVAPPPELQNAGEFSHKGIEAILRLRPGKRVMIDAAMTRYSHSESVLRVPWNTFDFALRIKPEALENRDLTLSLYGTYSSKINDAAADGSIVRLEDYFVASAKVRMKVAKNIYGFIEAENLTNKTYETILGIPMPERSVYGGGSIHW